MQARAAYFDSVYASAEDEALAMISGVEDFPEPMLNGMIVAAIQERIFEDLENYLDERRAREYFATTGESGGHTSDDGSDGGLPCQDDKGTPNATGVVGTDAAPGGLVQCCPGRLYSHQGCHFRNDRCSFCGQPRGWEIL